MTKSRRDFIKNGMMLGGGLALSDMLNLTTKITQGMITNAHAADFGVKKVLSFYAEGAIPNWMFNLCLYPEAEVIPDSGRIEGIGTGFNSSGLSIFSQKQKGNYWFPKIWFAPIPTVSGAWVSPENLLMNMMTVRGMWNPTDGHDLAHKMMYRPLGANYSVHGMIADAVSSVYPIPAIYSGSTVIQNEFASPKGLSSFGSFNPKGVLDTINSSFKEQASLFRGKGVVDSLVSAALTAMDDTSIFKKSSSNFNRKKADELVRSNLTTLITDYNTKLAKYKLLLATATTYVPSDSNTLVPDLLDLPLNQYNTLAWTPDTDDAPTIIFKPGQDLRDLFLTAPEFINVAESFAMAEVLFERNLNANVLCNIGGLRTVSPLVVDKTSGLPMSANKFFWSFDLGHSMGLSTQTLIWSMYTRGFITCLYEFISFLKSKNMYEDTVISFSSDFARAPQTSGRASDHGWQANATSFWSGEISEPVIVGNTMLDAASATGNNYAKLWGVGRKSIVLNNNIGIGNMNATFATLANAAPNTSNNVSLVLRDGGKIVGLEKPKTT